MKSRSQDGRCESEAMFTAEVESHLRALATLRENVAGAMWPSVLDVRTGDYPGDDHIPERVYRLIGAPRGSTLYWDQPQLVAAHALSRLTGDRAYGEAADRYVQAFLDACVADNGVFAWGNHVYYDVFSRQVVRFCDGHHELRPLTPEWDLFWRLAPEATERYIRVMVARHIYDPETGGFNRHDDGKRGHAFIEAGGVLVESLGWLYGKTQDPELLDTALRIARYSFKHRNPETGLVPNEPDMGRWDAKVCTTEIGLWAQCLLRAASSTGCGAFAEMADAAIRAYLQYGYDATRKRYAGQLCLRTGAWVEPEEPGYWPRRDANPWNAEQWPTHDYPMALAKVCLQRYQDTGDAIFREAVERWVHVLLDMYPDPASSKIYAEDYGHAIDYLTAVGKVLGDGAATAAAAGLARDAVAHLYREPLFAGYTGGHMYEAVDGVGYLLQALLPLDA